MKNGIEFGFLANKHTQRRALYALDRFDQGLEYFYLTNKGAQGSVLYSSQEDFDRFEAYLYLLNAIDGPRASNYFLPGRTKDIFTATRGEALVAIGAYSFTPRSFSIVAIPCAPKGIGKFMQKLQTAYTMYFNMKYQRSGRLFHSAYRSERITTDAKLQYFLARTHLAPAELFDANWEEIGYGIADERVVNRGVHKESNRRMLLTAENHNKIRTNEHRDALRVLAVKAARYRYSSIGEFVEKKFIITNPKYFPEYFLKSSDIDFLTKIWMRNSIRHMSNSPQ